MSALLLRTGLFSVEWAVVLLGAGLLSFGYYQRQDADNDRLEGAFQILASKREVAVIRTLFHEEGAERSLERLVVLTNRAEPHQARLLEELAACIGDPKACNRPVKHIYGALETSYDAQLQETWDNHATRVETIQIVFAVGSILLLLGLALEVYRKPRPDPKVVQDLRSTVTQKSEQLYEAQLALWEKDTFAAFGEVSAGLSHGLKTPLATIRAMAQLSRQRLESNDPLRENLDNIISEVDKLVQQVTQFLRATTPKSFEPRIIEASDILELVGDSYGLVVSSKGITVHQDAGDAGKVLVDLDLIRVALNNLLENALHASPEGAHVWLSAVRIEPDPHAEAGSAGEVAWVDVCVSDEGPGFGYGESSKHSTGLGMSIAKSIVTRHRGSLSIEAREPKGTTVRVRLPAG